MLNKFDSIRKSLDSNSTSNWLVENICLWNSSRPNIDLTLIATKTPAGSQLAGLDAATLNLQYANSPKIITKIIKYIPFSDGLELRFSEFSRLNISFADFHILFFLQFYAGNKHLAGRTIVKYYFHVMKIFKNVNRKSISSRLT